MTDINNPRKDAENPDFDLSGRIELSDSDSKTQRKPEQLQNQSPQKELSPEKKELKVPEPEKTSANKDIESKAPMKLKTSDEVEISLLGYLLYTYSKAYKQTFPKGWCQE